jgi:hypothetical protein
MQSIPVPKIATPSVICRRHTPCKWAAGWPPFLRGTYWALVRFKVKGVCDYVAVV